jgi:hypothetical protein
MRTDGGVATATIRAITAGDDERRRYPIAFLEAGASAAHLDYDAGEFMARYMGCYDIRIIAVPGMPVGTTHTTSSYFDDHPIHRAVGVRHVLDVEVPAIFFKQGRAHESHILERSIVNLSRLDFATGFGKTGASSRPSQDVSLLE